MLCLGMDAQQRGVGDKALFVSRHEWYVAGDTRDPFDFTLAGIGLQQLLYGGLPVWIQDVHFIATLGERG